MAIVIKKSNIFGSPGIDIITDNKISQVNYNNREIKSSEIKSAYSKTITCWSIPEDAEYYVFNEQDQDGIKLYKQVNGTETKYYAEVDLNFNSDFYFDKTLPFDSTYFNFNIQSYSSDSSSSISQSASFESSTFSYISSNKENKGVSLYTKIIQPVLDDYDSTGIVIFYPVWYFIPYENTNNIYYDYVKSKLYVYLGRSDATNKFIFTTISFNLEIYCSTYILDQETKELGTGDNSFTMETNSFMNEILNSSGVITTHFRQQAENIISDYLLGKVVANISINYGKYYNEDGTIAYSGEDGQVIKIGDEVTLELENINKTFIVNKSEIVYSGNSLINLSLEEKLTNVGINQSIGKGASVVYTRTSSPRGLSTGVISSATKLYEGDVIKIDLSLEEEKYQLNNFIVEGGSFVSGQSITISGDLDVSITTTPKPYTLSLNIDSNLESYSIKRTSSPIGNASVGTELTNNATIYYGDVISISTTASTGYFSTTYVNNVESTSSNIEVTNNTSITIDTNIITSIFSTSAIDLGVNYTITRTSSPLGNATLGTITNGTTLYYNDVIKVVYSAQDGYSITNAYIDEYYYPINSGDSITITKRYINERNYTLIYIFAVESARWRTVSDDFSWSATSGELTSEIFTINGIRANTPTRIRGQIQWEYRNTIDEVNLSYIQTCCGYSTDSGGIFQSEDNDFSRATLSGYAIVMGVNTPTNENEIEIYGYIDGTYYKSATIYIHEIQQYY